MKIKTKNMTYEKAMAMDKGKTLIPKRPSIFFRVLLKIVGSKDLKATQFTCEKVGMEKLGPREPALFLMNHSAFIDLEIASSLLFPRPFNIICTSDGFVGKRLLMRELGCVPTKKFISDLQVVKDIFYCINTLKDSVLMYPEASYSFDGTATPLPLVLGKLIKRLEVPVIMIRTYGAFQRDPLYNGLKLRKVKVSSKMEYIISPEQCRSLSANEINGILEKHFSFDNFAWQIENRIRIDETFRAEGLNRVLYKCPHCTTEGKMEASGTKIRCKECDREYELTEFGQLVSTNGESKFSSVPDWYRWERECVKEEIKEGTYKLDIPVKISIMRNTKCICNIGEGRLVHTDKGFHLTGCDGKLDFSTTPLESYSLYSDYFWYEIGDVICIGKQEVLYYCFPQNCGDVVAKTRLAAEELFKLSK